MTTVRLPFEPVYREKPHLRAEKKAEFLVKAVGFGSDKRTPLRIFPRPVKFLQKTYEAGTEDPLHYYSISSPTYLIKIPTWGKQIMVPFEVLPTEGFQEQRIYVKFLVTDAWPESEKKYATAGDVVEVWKELVLESSKTVMKFKEDIVGFQQDLQTQAEALKKTPEAAIFWHTRVEHEEFKRASLMMNELGPALTRHPDPRVREEYANLLRIMRTAFILWERTDGNLNRGAAEDQAKTDFVVRNRTWLETISKLAVIQQMQRLVAAATRRDQVQPTAESVAA